MGASTHFSLGETHKNFFQAQNELYKANKKLICLECVKKVWKRGNIYVYRKVRS
jgi:hypothetical protein